MGRMEKKMRALFFGAFALLFILLIPEAHAKKSVQPLCAGKQSSDFSCYQKHYQKLLRTKGVKVAFADLRQRYLGSEYIRAQCHPLTHVIGNAAVAKYPKVSDAYTHGDSFCWSGYYHGVMEGVIGRIGMKKLSKQLDLICKDIPGRERYNFDYYNCVHGLGHGLMAITGDELPQSLKLCDNLTGHWEQQSCWSGAFMENVIVDGRNHVTQYLKPDDPHYPCNGVDEKYRNICYLMQTSYMMKVTNGNFPKIFSLCREVQDELHRDTCFQSLGRDASGHSVSDVRKTQETCLLGQDVREQSNCIIGAVKDFISYFHSDTQATNLCMSLPLNLQEVCFATITSYYQYF